MHLTRPIRLCLTAVLALSAGLLLASVAAACPDERPATACKPPSHLEDNTSALSLPDPGSNPDLESPVLSGMPGAPRVRESDPRPLETALGWLLSGSGPRGGQKLSAERMSRSADKKPVATTETNRTSRAETPRVSGKPRWGRYQGHLAKPHRMPSFEIL